MKNNNTFRSLILVKYFALFLVFVLLGACGGGSENNNNNIGNKPPVGDMSGRWQVTGTDSSSAPACDGTTSNLTATIVQSGTNLSVSGLGSNSLSGSISGNQMSWSGSFPEGGGTTTISSSTSTITTDCNQFTGNDSWSWTDGTFSCSGTSTFTATRLSGNGCGGGSGSSSGNSAALDTTFGTNGKVVTDLGGDDIARAVTLDSANRVIVAGERNIAGSGDFVVARYGADGTLDSSFGTSGWTITNLGADDRGRAVVIDAAGRIVMGGDSLVTSSDFAIARYTRSGVLDTSFNGNGLVITDFNNTAEPAMDVTIDPNGKIVAAGFAHNGANYDFGIARYNDDGSLDTSFNTNGLLADDLGNDDRISAVAIDASGRIVAAGRTGSVDNYDIALARYNNDGRRDTTFGVNGVVIRHIPGATNQTRAIAFDASGRLVVAGRTGSSGRWNFLVMRYSIDGSPDTTFGTNGVVITDLGGNDRGRDVLIDASGRIMVLGTSDIQGSNDFTILRYNSDGSLDASFGSSGIATVDFGGDDRASGMALDTNGRLIVAGRSDFGSGNDFAVARILP